MKSNLGRCSFYGIPSRGTRYRASRPSPWSPYESVSEEKQETVSEPETPSNCKYNSNRNGEDKVELHSRNKEYLFSQEKETLTRWLQQNGVPFKDHWSKKKIVALVSRNYRMATPTPRPKRRGQWMRPNTTVAKWKGLSTSRQNKKRSASSPFASPFGGMSGDESQDEIDGNEEKNWYGKDLRKGLDFSAKEVDEDEEDEDGEDEDALMDKAMKAI